MLRRCHWCSRTSTGLTVFDGRYPHGVRPVEGTRDPLKARLVLSTAGLLSRHPSLRVGHTYFDAVLHAPCVLQSLLHKYLSPLGEIYAERALRHWAGPVDEEAAVEATQQCFGGIL